MSVTLDGALGLTGGGSGGLGEAGNVIAVLATTSYGRIHARSLRSTGRRLRMKRLVQFLAPRRLLRPLRRRKLAPDQVLVDRDELRFDLAAW